MSDACIVEHCEKPRHQRRRYCAMHAMRLHKHGTVELKRPTVMERFHAGYLVDPVTACWTWSRSRIEGYGRLTIEGRRTVRAHRWSYEQFVGPIPHDCVIDHLCRNRACVNPEHLEAVPQRENVIRGMSIPAIVHRNEVCLRGHSVTGANLYVPPGRPGQRACVECRRINVREWRARKASA